MLELAERLTAAELARCQKQAERLAVRSFPPYGEAVDPRAYAVILCDLIRDGIGEKP
jgi:hypothetical protein